MLDKIAIIGYSGHGYVVTESARSSGLAVRHYCDKLPNTINPFQLDYLGFEGDEYFTGWGKNIQFILGIGDNQLRSRIGLGLLQKEEVLLNVIDPSASLSTFLEMGVGNFVAKQVSVNALVRIGDFCILNTGAIIEHECTLADGVHIAPGAVLTGNVHIGTNTFIGANAVIKQGVKIGKNVVVGAGAVVINDILDHQTVVGNPGRIV